MVATWVVATFFLYICVLRTFHEWLAYIPLGVGADLSRPCMFVVVLWLWIRCVRVCVLLFRGCECICGYDKSAYTVGVGSVHGWCLQHIRLLLVAYIMVVCTVFSGWFICYMWYGDVCAQLFVHICFLFLLWVCDDVMRNRWFYLHVNKTLLTRK